MKFGLDYDNTYTRNTRMWDLVISVWQSFDVEVYLTTVRDEKHDWTDDMDRLETMGVKVICTRGVAKKPACEAKGIHIDIWVDDRPETVNADSLLTPSQVEAWRAQDQAARGVRPSA